MPHEAGQLILAAVVGLLIIIAADSFKKGRKPWVK